MKKIMEPVVYQMKEWGVKFKEEKFIIECDKLFNVNKTIYQEYEYRK